jgi:hypothetical protein
MADTVGNLLGSRAVYEYETDGGTSYNIQLDESVADAVGNDQSGVNLPVIRASGRKPFAPRYILLSLDSDPAVRKTAIICDVTNPLFARDSAGTVTINSVAWNITGRVGEKASFLVPTGSVGGT